jgi:hypothetical protein
METGNTTQNSLLFVILLYIVFVFSKMKHFLLEMSFSSDKGED